MAEGLNGLILPIGADPSQFKNSINDVKDAIKSLASTISATPFNLVNNEQKNNLAQLQNTLKALTTDVKNLGQAVEIPKNSIAGLTKRIADLNAKKITLDATKSVKEIELLSRRIENLTQLKNKIEGLGSSFNNIADGSKGARTALTSISLVAQDLPFGFIAIQNNLPSVIQSFGQLSAQAGGTIAAFKALGVSLIGPAGLFLAFSIVTAVITSLVQKYGTLGNAIKSIISNNEELGVKINKLNKDYETYTNNLDSLSLSIKKSEAQELGRIETINKLTSIVRDLSNSEKTRGNALEQLKKIDKDYYDQFETATLKSEELQAATDRLTKSIIIQAQARGLENRIAKITEQIEELNSAQEELAPSFEKTSKKLSESLKNTGQALGPGALPIPIGDIIGLDAITDQLEKGDNNIEEQTIKLQKTKDKLQTTLNDLVQIVQPKGGGAAAGKGFQLGIDAKSLEDAFDLDKIIANLTKYGNTLLDTSNNEKERKLALQKLLEINPEYFKGLSIEKKGLEQTKTSIENLITQYQILKKEREFDARASKLNADFLKKQIKSVEDLEKQVEKLQDIPNFEIDQLIDPAQFDKVFKGKRLVPKLSPEGLMIWDPIIKGAQLVQEEFTYVIKGIKNVSSSLKEGFKGLEIQTAIEEFASQFKTLGEVYDLTFKDIVEKNKEIASTIQGFLYQPLENVFDVLLSNGEKSWKEFGDAVIATIKRIAAQLLALSIAKTLANILAPGLGSISDAALKAFLGENVKNPTFGGLEGGMQMNGQVVFVQRGSDLVGVLNRTNSTIGRIG